ncbi:ABC transporter ATP-binding protein [Chitinophaga polysaccharea]|uniref:ABC transporter ATP-binding protein n=1 Tax=Chitinophaga TaxID=79328 RepID=UPI00145501C3|nr:MULTISPECIES: ABC transporter ATP-binding protein [Chitinophaga]NLR57847.1 ABC transporter ATP-binding protein [Chitinophaga polysaccharea]NLU93440.1 ABC transporter ATP-binding protein [Chitinophaga sp. Ak27]
MNTVVLDHITKHYDQERVLAVNDVSLQVRAGELFGLIGPDGAGKTSLFRILTTLLLPDKGQASVLGYDCVRDYRQIRNKIGYMPGKFSLYQDLTVKENLDFFATLFGSSIGENYTLIKDIYEQIKPFNNRRAGKLSGGMKQKLALCCALIHKPEVLFLDEPTTGVDVVSRKEFWQMLKNLKQQGITILVSTPYMDEAVLCEKIALIQGGNILSVDTPDGIRSKFPVPLYAIRSDNTYQLLTALRKEPGVDSSYAFGESIHITLNEQQTNMAAIQQSMVAKGHTQLSMEQIQPGIEDSFIRLMNQA